MKNRTLLVFLFTALSAGSVSAQSGLKYFPQVVFGDGSSAKVGVQNLDLEDLIISYKLVSAEGENIADGGALVGAGGTSFFDFESILTDRGQDLSALQVFWIRFFSEGRYGATGLQSLRVGGKDLLPYGVLPSPPCSRSGVIVAEDDRLRAGLVLLNTNFSNSITCDLTLSERSHSELVAQDSVEVSPFSTTSFFLDEKIDYSAGENRGLLVECSGEAVVYPLLQDRSTGDTNAVASTCSELE